jgi:uncharacterized OB-fold protein
MLGAQGTPAPFLSLAGALESAEPGDTVLVGAAGEGADAIALRVRRTLPDDSWRTGDLLSTRRSVTSYGDVIVANRTMDIPEPQIYSSPVRFWRDRTQYLNLHGMRCSGCGLVQYPSGRLCMRCHSDGPHDAVTLARRGRVFTYTLDHVVAASYSVVPVTRAIIDLDGGGRILTQVVDCAADELSVGMEVELTFRRMNDGGGFKNYYWKARPASGVSDTKERVA